MNKIISNILFTVFLIFFQAMFLNHVNFLNFINPYLYIFFIIYFPLKTNRSIFILIALPWLDTSKIRSAIFRPLYRSFFWILLIDVILLGYIGAKPPEGIYLILGRTATIYYFVHFLIILPVLGYYEKTKPLPLSLSEPVVDPHKSSNAI